jgi:hypothetical protein
MLLPPGLAKALARFGVVERVDDDVPLFRLPRAALADDPRP